MRYVKSVFLSVTFCLFASVVFAYAAHVDIGEALKRKIIRYQAVKSSSGLDITVTNLLHDSVYVEIGSGWIFPTADESMQPQVVSRSHMICLAEGEERRARLLTLCGNAPGRTVPQGYAEFLKPVLGKSDMVATLRELEPYKMDRKFIIQNIVWHYTNGHTMANFHPGNTGIDEYLTAMHVFQANEPDVVDPGYRIRYRESLHPEESVFTGASEEIEGHVSIKVNTATNCTVALLDQNGMLLKPLKYVNDQQPGEYSLSFKSYVLDLPKGNYSVAVFDKEGKTLGALPVEI
jgi:hypothetical protein